MTKKIYITPDEIKGRELRREVETLLRCDHSAIPKVVEFGLARKKEEFLLTTYFRGEDLETRVAGGRKLSLADSILVFGQVFDCLEHLDEKEIFHGFISPEKIVIDENTRVGLMGVGATPKEKKPFSVTISDPDTGKKTKIQHRFETHPYFPRFLDWHRAARCLAFGLYGEDLLKSTRFDRDYDLKRMASHLKSLSPDLPEEIADFLVATMTQNGTFSHVNSFFLRFVEVAQKYASPDVKEESWWRKFARKLNPSGLW
ncbi:MAG: protein kinase [Candidatus Eremiobacteraeota bacterium]|nr:protein kinase [Candidatus Eremiobacteraeota bacterium]